MAVATTVKNKVHLFLKLASQKVQIAQAFIFGSSTRDGRNEWSDIDLAIVSPDFSGDPFEDSKIFFPIILQVDRSIEVHPFHPDDFSSENPFVREILNTGVKIS